LKDKVRRQVKDVGSRQEQMPSSAESGVMGGQQSKRGRVQRTRGRGSSSPPAEATAVRPGASVARVREDGVKVGACISVDKLIQPTTGSSRRDNPGPFGLRGNESGGNRGRTRNWDRRADLF